MSESTPRHGSSLPDQVDLTADVQPEGPLALLLPRRQGQSSVFKASLQSSVFNSRVLLAAVQQAGHRAPDGVASQEVAKNKINPITPHLATHALLLGPTPGF